MQHTPEEIASIKASLLWMKGSGLRPRIIIDRSTKTVLDGERIAQLAAELGIETDTVFVDVADPVEARLRLMFARRHPSELARAMEVVRELGAPIAAAQAKNKGQDVATLQRPGRTCEILAEIANCSPSTINNATAILAAKDVRLEQLVREQKIPTNTAVKLARRTQKDRASLLAAREDTDTRLTPEWVIAPVQRLAGGTFDLDPCTIDGKTFVNAKHTYTMERDEDGLDLDWHMVLGNRIRTIWVNPPFTDTAPWIRKALDTVAERPEIAIWMLLPSTTFGTPAAEMLEDSNGYVYLRRRAQFLTRDLVPLIGSAEEGTIIVAFGAADLDGLEELGQVHVPYKRMQSEVKNLRERIADLEARVRHTKAVGSECAT